MKNEQGTAGAGARKVQGRGETEMEHGFPAWVDQGLSL